MQNLFIKMPSIEIISEELREQWQFFNKFKMHQSSKFLIELLNSKTVDFSNKFLNQFYQNNLDSEYQFESISFDRENINLQDQLFYLRNLFDLREYKKCAFKAEQFFKENQNNEILFYYLYCNYIHNNIRQEESKEQEYLINTDLERAIQSTEKIQLNIVNKYIITLIKQKQHKYNEIIEELILILNENPFFWSAWLDLCQTLIITEQKDPFLFLGKIKNHWMKNFFSAVLLNEAIKSNQNYENYCYDICCGLWAFFSKSTFILDLLAVVFHNISNYDNSMEFFQTILKIDPYRFENIDVLSNILYVKEKQNELGKLAITCFENDKYIPETCCVLGNYYSLIGDHLQAAKYFQRAISLDKHFLPAYTLLGHEYLELKNVTSAIEAYNQAVRINKRDFRAWYGLGQAYELQNHLEFALYYFLQALKSNPRDSRMWNAIGNCYNKLNKKNEAVKCLEKAKVFKDHEGISLFQLGKLYDMMNQTQKAVQCFEENVLIKKQKKQFDKELGEALLYLAQFYKSINDYPKALEFASQLLDFSGIEKQEAQNLIYDINTLQNK